MTRVPVERILLYTIGAAGLMALLAVAPGMGAALKMFGVHKKLRQHSITNTLSRLKYKGYVRIIEKDGKKYVNLTDTGKKRLDAYQHKKLTGPRLWDGKWRMVTFDIPERYRTVRDQVRYQLKEAGFIQLHQSVWVTPYECEEFISLLKADRRIGKGLLYVLAEKLEYDKNLRAHFHLS